MAIKTDLNKAILDEVYGLYADAEARMLERIASRVKRGVSEPGWTESKLSDVQRLKRETESILGNASVLSKKKMSDSILGAYIKGVASASKDAGIPFTGMRGLIPPHMQRLILDTHQLVDTSGMQILRNTQDVYRQVIAETSTGVLMGVETRTAAAQEALNRFAAKGITGFTDKAGRRWDMGSYVDMAMRTTTSRAAIQGHLDRQAEIGNDLIRVSSLGTTCPICARWQGKVLSISGSDPKRPSLESAKADGLFHPNCKHTITAFFEDVPGWSPKEPDAENAELYEATQRQRYNERQIRKWKRVESVALSPAEKAKAARKVAQWQSIQRDHIKATGLRRKYGREGGASYTPNASRAKPERYVMKPKIDIGLPPGYTWEDYEKSLGKQPKPKEKVQPVVTPIIPSIVPHVVVAPPPVVVAPPTPPPPPQPVVTPIEEPVVATAVDKPDVKANVVPTKAELEEMIDVYIAGMDDEVNITKRLNGIKAAEFPSKSFKKDLHYAFNNQDTCKASRAYRKLLAAKGSQYKIKPLSAAYGQSSGAYYSHRTKTCYVDFKNDFKIAQDRRNPNFTTTFHETGHLVDYGFGNISADKRLLSTLREDYDDLLAQFNGGKKPMTQRAIRDSQDSLSDMIQTDRLNGSVIHGVSDTLSGLSLNEVNGGFGHSTDYWTLNGKASDIERMRRVSSEFFATASAAMTSQGQYEYMTKMLPKSMKRYEELIEETLRKEAKKKIKQLSAKATWNLEAKQALEKLRG